MAPKVRSRKVAVGGGGTGAIASKVELALRHIPRGEVVTFKELAELIDQTGRRGPGIVGRIVRLAACADPAANGRTPWWRAVRAGNRKVPLASLLPGPHGRAAVQRRKLKKELGERRLAAPLVRDTTVPNFMREHFEDVVLEPSTKHTHTLIYMHGFGQRGGRCRTAVGMPWVEPLTSSTSGLRVLFPTAPRMLHPSGELKNSWYGFVNMRENTVGDHPSLVATRSRIRKMLTTEISRLKGAAHQVYLGGMSQGCGVAMDIYCREGVKLGLGGFVGVAGWLPSDSDGFVGANSAVSSFVTAKSPVRKRPLWLMVPTDDHKEVPWALARKSLKRIEGHLPGLLVRKVSGRGHGVGDWEGKFLREFLSSAVGV